MIYSGGFFTKLVESDGQMIANKTYLHFIDSFANSDASVGLVLDSFVALLVTVLLYTVRKTLKFSDSLDAKTFVAGVVSGSASSFMNFLPAIIFVIAAFLAFATGTSWKTFGILIPICIAIFPQASDPLKIISISACMAGAVCSDHISPISDTTIMASAGAQCNHVKHVCSQLPYALSCAGISFVTYIFAGFVKNAPVSLAFGLAAMMGFLFAVKK